jgi:hypothetical protein
MAIPGPKPKGKVSIRWSANFAYAIGLIVSDGYLSNNGRHIIFVSKDRVQINNFLKALKIKSKIGKVLGARKTWAYRVQFSDVLFYEFLESIGIMNAKSKIIGAVGIPDKYFRDFLRGLFDGDGYSYSYWDKRWKSSFMFYIGFASASVKFIYWLRGRLDEQLKIKGHVTHMGIGKSCLQLKYAKKEALVIKKFMYYKGYRLHLPRKLLKIERSLYIVGKSKRSSI